MASASPSITIPGGGSADVFRMPRINLAPSANTVLLLIVGALVLEQVVYRNRKRHLPGDRFTIPIIGRFADSLKPDIENYKKGWRFPLAAVSVFHMCVHTTESSMARSEGRQASL
jgi:C-22 sterol desaturase